MKRRGFIAWSGTLIAGFTGARVVGTTLREPEVAPEPVRESEGVVGSPYREPGEQPPEAPGPTFFTGTDPDKAVGRRGDLFFRDNGVVGATLYVHTGVGWTLMPVEAQG